MQKLNDNFGKLKVIISPSEVEGNTIKAVLATALEISNPVKNITYNAQRHCYQVYMNRTLKDFEVFKNISGDWVVLEQ